MVSIVKLSECVLKQGSASHFQLKDRCWDFPFEHLPKDSASHHIIVDKLMSHLERECNVFIVFLEFMKNLS